MPLNNPVLVPGVKFKAETRSMQAASGDVSYTGYGFTPKGLIIFAFNPRGSIGISIEDRTMVLVHESATQTNFNSNAICKIEESTGVRQDAIVASYDVDGFTLTWTKSGAPGANTVVLKVLAIK